MFRFVGMHGNKYGILDTDDGVIDYITKEELIKYTNMGIKIHDLHKLRDNNKRQEINKRQDHDKRQDYNKKPKESNSLAAFKRMCMLCGKQPKRLNEIDRDYGYLFNGCENSFFIRIDNMYHIYLNDNIFLHREDYKDKRIGYIRSKEYEYCDKSILRNRLREIFWGKIKLYGCNLLTDFRDAFIYCYKIDAIDFSNADLSNVTDMSCMLEGCDGLKSINFSGANLSNVVNMKGMFRSSDNIESVNFSGADLSSVTDMSYMFSSCVNLKSVDFSGADLSSVTDMSWMFYCCSEKLESINFSGVNLSNVIKTEYMFSRFADYPIRCKIIGSDKF